MDLNVLQQLFIQMRVDARTMAIRTVYEGLDPREQESLLMERYPDICVIARDVFLEEHKLACNELGRYQRSSNDN